MIKAQTVQTSELCTELFQ